MPDAGSRPEEPRPIARGPLRRWVPTGVFGIVGVLAVVGGLRHPYWPLVVAGAVLLVAAGSAATSVRLGFDVRWGVLSLLLLGAALVFLVLVSPQVTSARS